MRRPASARRSARPVGGPARPLDLPTSLVGSALVVALVLLHAWNPPLIESLRLKVFDELQLLYPSTAEPAVRTVVVDIDDDSLRRFGQWPWPRTLLADLTKRLGGLGATAIGFDVIFSEPDRLSPPVYAAAIESLDPGIAATLRGLADNDAVMAQALMGLPTILGIAGVPRPLGAIPGPAAPGPTVALIGGNPAPFMRPFADVTPIVPTLRDAATGAGLVTLIPDVDGIIRRVPLVGRVADRILPSLSLEALRVVLRERTIVVRTDARGLREVLVRGYSIPTEPDGRVWLRHRRDRLPPVVSAADVLAGRADREQIAGRIALVGSSAAGLGDIKSTPGGAMPGVEVQAQLLEALTRDDHLRRPAAAGAERVGLAAVGLALAWLGPMLGAAWLPPLLAAVLLGTAGLTWLSFARFGLLVDGGYVAVALSVLMFWLAMAKFIREEAQRRTIRHAFGRYLSPVMVDRLAASRNELKLGGERRELTVLFSDIRGFTSLSEGFTDDPEGLTSLLNGYLTTMTDAIQGSAGTIDKYIGDAIMAFWNAPLPTDRHARHACLAALEMRRRLAGFNAEVGEGRDDAGGVSIRAGIGINTGYCFVGNLGSEQRFNYSVLGDAVNIASRLEGSSKLYGVDIVIGESTRVQSSDLAALEVDRVRLVGKARATQVYALLGDETLAADAGFQELARAHLAMLKAYRVGDWDEAERHLARCSATAGPHGLSALYDLYARRVRRCRDIPPPTDWDGTEQALSKD